MKYIQIAILLIFSGCVSSNFPVTEAIYQDLSATVNISNSSISFNCVYQSEDPTSDIWQTLAIYDFQKKEAVPFAIATQTENLISIDKTVVIQTRPCLFNIGDTTYGCTTNYTARAVVVVDRSYLDTLLELSIDDKGKNSSLITSATYNDILKNANH